MGFRSKINQLGTILVFFVNLWILKMNVADDVEAKGKKLEMLKFILCVKTQHHNKVREIPGECLRGVVVVLVYLYSRFELESRWICCLLNRSDRC